ncbi:predicted repair protein [Crocosphaera chwakensis CCY0110]|uniref:Predicted repair protein n=2 Tax=Crocosphaera TaxID=263510 RepID=A3IRS5_9CHRO|nr:predicted repair protein [Crocosphaera chwakensis CCY0110]
MISETTQMIDKHQNNVLTILFMRFDVNPSEGIKIAEGWLKEYSQETWETLLRLLKSNQLTLVNKELKPVTQSTKITAKNSNQLQEKKRRYRGIEY